MKLKLYKYLLILLFIIGTYYTLFVQTEKYSSIGTVIVQDLSNEQSISTIGALLTNSPQSGTRDSLIIDIYLRSYDMFRILDKEFNLTAYYSSEQIGFAERLYPDTQIEYFKANHANLLKRYNQDIITLVDPASSTFQIGFRHAEPKTAKAIVEKIIHYAFVTLNRFEKENGKIVLDFLRKQAEQNRRLFISSVKKMIAYQNKHQTIDPQADIKFNSALVAELESELIKKEVAYSSQLQQKSKNAPSMKILRSSIKQIKQKIQEIKAVMSGKKAQDTLNINAFQFEMLKSESELAKEIYKQTLVKLEEAKVTASKSAKNLTIVTHPTLPDQYDSPKKARQIISLLIILSFLYGIVALIASIIESHKD